MAKAKAAQALPEPDATDDMPLDVFTEDTSDELEEAGGDPAALIHGEMHADASDDEHHEAEMHNDELGVFIEPSSMEAPPAKPGMQQRWVRMSFQGKPDAKNSSVMMRLGWRPRALESVPAGLRKQYPAFRHPKFGDVIMQGDLVLCERPVAFGNAESKHYRDKAQRQVDLTDMLAGGPAAVPGFSRVQVVERRKKVVMRKPIQAADGG